MLNTQMVESLDGWHALLIDARIAYIHVDFRIGLDIAGVDLVGSLVMETPFQLLHIGRELIVTPGEIDTIAPVLHLFNLQVNEVRIHRDGQLMIQFANGDQLKILPNDDYEAWQLSWGSNSLFVCQPGGTLAVFQEDNSDE